MGFVWGVCVVRGCGKGGVIEKVGRRGVWVMGVKGIWGVMWGC